MELADAGGAGHVVGEIVPVIGCASGYVPEGCVPCDGTEYSRSQFTTLYDEYLTDSNVKLVTCSYADYASDISAYGQCAKWAIDTSTQKFKVPTIKDGSFLQQAQSNGEIGKSYNAGLPNIEGSVTNMWISGASYSGAFSTSGTGSANKANQGTGTSYNISFNSSDSNSIYGNSTTVQPNSITVRYFICVAGGSVNQSMMDWSAWASGLAGKLNADGTNLGTTTGTGTVKAVTESYYDSTTGSWYRVWSDGWIEQGGIAIAPSGGQYNYQITFIKEYTSANYSVSISVVNSSAYSKNSGTPSYDGIANRSPFINRQTTTGFYMAYIHADVGNKIWYACGY